MRLLSIVVVTMLTLTGVAFSGQLLYPTEDCNKIIVQADLNQCAWTNYQAADAALNKTYQALQAKQPDAGAKTHLRRSERTWIAVRDKLCADEVGPREDSGTIWPVEMSNCLEEKTAARLRELKRGLDCAEHPGVCSR